MERKLVIKHHRREAKGVEYLQTTLTQKKDQNTQEEITGTTAQDSKEEEVVAEVGPAACSLQ